MADVAVEKTGEAEKISNGFVSPGQKCLRCCNLAVRRQLGSVFSVVNDLRSEITNGIEPDQRLVAAVPVPVTPVPPEVVPFKIFRVPTPGPIVIPGWTVLVVLGAALLDRLGSYFLQQAALQALEALELLLEPLMKDAVDGGTCQGCVAKALLSHRNPIRKGDKLTKTHRERGGLPRPIGRPRGSKDSYQRRGKKGRKKTGGRKKGTPNKRSRKSQ